MPLTDEQFTSGRRYVRVWLFVLSNQDAVEETSANRLLDPG